MSDHKQMFLSLYGKDEGGRMNAASGNVYMVYMCRICQLTVISETDWIQHLLSDSHQSIHRNHQLLRKVLWDLNRTIAITNVMGIPKRNILNYLIRCGCQVVDFSYLSAKDGGTACCYALLSEMNNLSNPSSPHSIEGKMISIRHIDDKEKRKYLKWRENLIGKK